MGKQIEKYIEFTNGITLKGTLTIPEGVNKPPVVVMIHGSGNVDRDENAKGLQINVFKYLTQFFVSKGFATLRYDKRGVGESGGSFLEAGFWDLVEDAAAAVDFVRTQEGINTEQIILLGHSEGAIIAPAVHKKVKAQGLILLAGISECLKDTLENYQMKIFKEEVEVLKGFQGKLLRFFKIGKKAVEKQKKLFEKILTSDQTVIKDGLVKLNAKWYREHFQYNVSDDLKEVACPVIAITGDHDIQVNPEQVKEIAGLTKGPSEYHIIPKMNHLLRKQEQPMSLLKLKNIYKKSAKKTLDEEMLNLIEKWVVKHYHEGTEDPNYIELDQTAAR